MTLILSGTNGLSDVDGSAATPAIRGTDANTGMFFPAADTIAFAEGGVEAMRLDSAGNLGLGVTPTTGGYGRGIQFNDASDGCVNTLWSQAINTDDRRMSLTNNAYNSGVGAWKYGKSSTSATMYQTQAGQHQFFNAPSGTAGNAISFTQAMTLDASGNLLVGVSIGTRHILSKSNANSYGTVIDNTSGTNPYALGVQLTGVTGGAGIAFIECRDNAQRMLVAGNGNVTNVNNSYGAISDAKLKENVVDATPKLDKLNQVRIVNFNIIGDEQKQLGVIAQELEQIFPGMVEEAVDRDNDGNDLGTTTKSVKYSVFVPMLIKAIQEQQIMIEQLKADVAALKGTV